MARLKSLYVSAYISASLTGVLLAAVMTTAPEPCNALALSRVLRRSRITIGGRNDLLYLARVAAGSADRRETRPVPRLRVTRRI